MDFIWRNQLIKARQFLDIVAMATCFALSAVLVSFSENWTSLSDFLSLRVSLKNVIVMISLLMLWSVIFSTFGLYKPKVTSRWEDEARDITKASVIGALLVCIVAGLMKMHSVSSLFLTIFLISVTAATLGERLILRYFLRRLVKNGKNLRNLVVIGVNDRSMNLVKKIESIPELGYKFVGFVDEMSEKVTNAQGKGYAVACGLDGFQEYLMKNVVDEVVICLPLKSFYEHILNITRACEEQGITIKFLRDLFSPKRKRIEEDQLEDGWLVSFNPGEADGWGAFVKRVFDVISSGLLILLLSPLFLVTAVLIKATSRGPVFFAQERLGLGKRRFRMYKFRTMVPDAEKRLKEVEHLNEAEGPVFKIKEDPRIIPIGKLLRKTSIDELPQLFNVLKGDISLVGPRPLPVRDYEGFKKEWHFRRFSVRPGITGVWQISGRSNITFDKWMEMDMNYIDNWSVWNDMLILLKTVPAVVKRTGAA